MASSRFCLFVKAFLLACCVYGSAYAGTKENAGLVITTSDRWLATVAHGGACMSITCAYTMDDATKAAGHTVKSITIKRFNPDSASFNEEVETISLANQAPMNANPDYKPTFNKLTETYAQLSVSAARQKICQYSRFQCVVRFTDVVSETGIPTTKQAIRVDSFDDVLPFTNVNSKKEWLITVTDFITEQVNQMNKRMTGALATLGSRVSALETTFNGRIAELNQELQEGINAAKNQIEASSTAVNIGVNTLKTQTESRIGTLESDVTAAIGNLRTNVDNKISSVELQLTGKFGEVATSVDQRFGSLEKESTNRFAGLEAAASTLIASLRSDMDRVQGETQTNIDNLNEQILSSLQGLGKIIETRTTKQLQTGQANTNQLKDMFSTKFDQSKTTLNQGVAKVDGKVSSFKNVVDTGLAQLKTDTVRLTQALEEQIADGSNNLKSVVSGRVDALTDALNTQVTSLRDASSAGNQDVTDNLSSMEIIVLESVNSLQQAAQDKISEFNIQLNSTSIDTVGSISSQLTNLDTSLVQTADNLKSQLNEVKESARSSVANVRDTTKNGIATVRNDVLQQLSSLQNSALTKVQQVNKLISTNANAQNTVVNQKVTKLQSNIAAKITQVSGLLSQILTSVSTNQDNSIAEMNAMFDARLTQLGERVVNLTRTTSENLEDSYSKIGSDFQQVVNTLTPVINSVQASTVSRLGEFEQNTKKSISGVQQSVQGKITSTQAATDNEVTNIGNTVTQKTAEVTSRNNKVSEKITELVALEKDIQSSIQQLDSRFDATNDLYGQLESKLTGVDTKFTGIEDFNTASFATIEKTLDDITQRYSTSIGAIGNGLTILEKTRSEGQQGFKTHITDINVYLTDTSMTLYNDMSRNFDTLEGIVDKSDETLRGYLKPEHCVEGMGFTASASLEYVVIPESKNNPYDILCDARTEHGGWIMIQRRRSGNTNFYRNWDDYKNGFGQIHEDFWLGLERIHQLTSQNQYELRVDLQFNGMSRFAKYTTFSIGDEASNYKMSLRGYSGTAGDSMRDTNGMGFTTHDRDNDKNEGANCAISSVGGWWYNNCQLANLNGVWGRNSFQGPRWNTFTRTNPVVVSEMKIRLKNPAS